MGILDLEERKTIGNAGPERVMSKTQNLCCPREGRVNTKWKLVRKPGWEMGSTKGTVISPTFKSSYWGFRTQNSEFD